MVPPSQSSRKCWITNFISHRIQSHWDGDSPSIVVPSNPSDLRSAFLAVVGLEGPKFDRIHSRVNVYSNSAPATPNTHLVTQSRAWSFSSTRGGKVHKMTRLTVCRSPVKSMYCCSNGPASGPAPVSSSPDRSPLQTKLSASWLRYSESLLVGRNMQANATRSSTARPVSFWSTT